MRFYLYEAALDFWETSWKTGCFVSRNSSISTSFTRAMKGSYCDPSRYLLKQTLRTLPIFLFKPMSMSILFGSLIWLSRGQRLCFFGSWLPTGEWVLRYSLPSGSYYFMLFICLLFWSLSVKQLEKNYRVFNS